MNMEKEEVWGSQRQHRVSPEASPGLGQRSLSLSLSPSAFPVPLLSALAPHIPRFPLGGAAPVGAPATRAHGGPSPSPRLIASTWGTWGQRCWPDIDLPS